MASKRNDFSSLINHELDPDLFIGFRFHPTYAEGIRIVKKINTGGEFPPIFNVYCDLFQCPPELLEECHCLTKLELLGKNKVNRTLRDGSRRYWKNIKSVFVRDDNNDVIGWVTKLKLHMDKNTTTEWHILEYRDTEMPDAGRWVLCQIYKSEKNNDSGNPCFFDPYIGNTTVPHVASDVGTGQISSSTSQVSITRASGASEDMNQGHHYEKGQGSNTQPDRFLNAATYPHQLTGEHMNQDQIHGEVQPWYTPQDSMVYNSQPFTSNTYTIDGSPINTATRTRSPDGCDMYPNQYINSNPFGGNDDWIEWNPDQSFNSNQFGLWDL